MTTHDSNSPESVSGLLSKRRSVREFDPARDVPRETIERLLDVARNAPSGANCQPFHFLAIHDPATKQTLREVCETVERDFYANQVTAQQRIALAPLGVDANKPMLTDAPWLIVVSRVRSNADGPPHYYSTQSTWLAGGILIAAITAEGLVTVPYTPRPTRTIATALGLDETFDPILILPVGYAAEASSPPDIGRKPADQTTKIIE